MATQLEKQQQTIRTVDEMNRERNEAVNRIVAELTELAVTDYITYQCQARGCSFDAAMGETYEGFERLGASIGRQVAEAFMRIQMADPIWCGRS